MIVSVQVVDATFGMPAADVRVQLRQGEPAEWRELTHGRTGPDGRLELWRGPSLRRGTYQLECDLDGFYSAVGCVSLFPRVLMEFRLTAETEDLHLPLVISPNFVLAYRGSASPQLQLAGMADKGHDGAQANET